MKQGDRHTDMEIYIRYGKMQFRRNETDFDGKYPFIIGSPADNYVLNGEMPRSSYGGKSRFIGRGCRRVEWQDDKIGEIYNRECFDRKTGVQLRGELLKHGKIIGVHDVLEIIEGLEGISESLARERLEFHVRRYLEGVR